MSANVLRSVVVADADPQRAEALCEACRGRGLATRSVPHGAAALESVLEEVPGLVITSLDLPVIDGARLASILRANPKTQSVRFLFLDPEDSSDQGGDLLDPVLTGEVRPGEVARRADELLVRQESVEKLERAGDQHGVTGKLSQISLPDLIQLFHVNRKSGSFELTTPEAGGETRRGLIHFREGEIIQASVGEVDGEKALFRLLGWTEGQFAFKGEASDLPPRILTPTRALLMEGMRQLDEYRRAAPQLPAAEAHVSLRVKTADLPNTIHPLTQEVLLLLEIYSRVQDVVDRCSYPDYQVLRTLHTLSERGMVKIRRGASPTSGAPAEGFFSRAQARRLREWLGGAGEEGAGTQDAKLLLASADPAATHDFVRLLRGLPGARLEGSFAGGNFSPEDLAPIGRLPVDSEVGIRLLHVPTHERYGPLWPAVAHRALGTVLLMAGTVSGSTQALGPISEAVRAQPDARVFHVVLVRKGERTLADELRDNVSLFDQASLFLVPLERDQEPLALLRGLLTRILP